MNKKILVIDDDPLVLRSIRKILTKKKYNVEEAKNSEDAITKCEDSNFDLILCDIRMPGNNGLQTIERIRLLCEEKNRSEIPVIFITGYASEDAPIKAVKLKAKDYILKPFDMDELLESIENVISEADE